MKDRKPTFIIISPGFARDEKDSACLPAQQVFVNTLNKNYPELNIIILALEYPFIKSTYQWNGNTVVSFNGWGKGKLKKIFNWISVWRALNKLKQQHNIIGIISFWCTQATLIGSYFAKHNHLINYSWILGQDAKKENKYVKWIRPKANELIALSDFMAMDFYKNHLVLPNHIIPLGINADLFSKENNTRDIDILGAGSLIPLKQYELFIELIAQLKNNFSTIKVVLCGKGPEEKKLKQLIINLGLENNISLVGEKPHAEVLKMMQRTKIFLHPSSYEGFGMVCIEALGAGAHVISFCKPMADAILHWHIAKNKNDMLQRTIALLQNDTLNHLPVIPYPSDECAKKIMHLFNYHTPEILKPIAAAHANEYN